MNLHHSNVDFIIGSFVETVSQSPHAKEHLQEVTAFVHMIYPRYLKSHRILKNALRNGKPIPACVSGFVSARSMQSKQRWGPLYWFVLYDMANEAAKMGCVVAADFERFFVGVLPRILPCPTCIFNMLTWLRKRRVSEWVRLTPFSMVFNLHNSVWKDTHQSYGSMPLKKGGVMFFSEDAAWATEIVEWLRKGA